MRDVAAVLFIKFTTEQSIWSLFDCFRNKNKKLSQVFLSVVYGAMNILSFVALRNIGAGLFTIFAQLKILTTTSCSVVMLDKHYSWVKWRAILSLIVGVLIFSESEWNKSNAMFRKDGNSVIGIGAVLTEVTLSGFASIYFEKVIKVDVDCYNIWERNFQVCVNLLFINQLKLFLKAITEISVFFIHY